MWLSRLYYKSKDRVRLVVMNAAERNEVLRESHDSSSGGGHYGVQTTVKKVSASYFWDDIKSDTQKWVGECPQCQRSEKIRTVAPVLHPIVVTQPWTVIGVDLVGPLACTKNSKCYIMTVTDLFTKWVIAKPLCNKSGPEVSQNIADVLLDFGLVEKIITDRGREFVNDLNKGVFDAFGI